VRHLHAHGGPLELLGLGPLGGQGVEEVEVRAADGGGLVKQAIEPSRYLPQPQLYQALLHPGGDVLLPWATLSRTKKVSNLV
jgi:hypothetical protein